MAVHQAPQDRLGDCGQPLACRRPSEGCFWHGHAEGAGDGIVPKAHEHGCACSYELGRASGGQRALGRDLRRACACPAGLLGGAAVSANGTGDGAPAALPQPAVRRKFWGWGLEGEGLSAGEIEQLGAASPSASGSMTCACRNRLEWRSWTCARRGWRRRRRFSRHLARTRMTGRPTRTAGRSAIWCLPFAGTTRMRLILWHSRAARKSWCRCWNGAVMPVRGDPVRRWLQCGRRGRARCR